MPIFERVPSEMLFEDELNWEAEEDTKPPPAEPRKVTVAPAKPPEAPASTEDKTSDEASVHF